MKQMTIKQPVEKGYAKVPVILQMEALECGAASLTMILAYYDKWIPLEQVRQDCGVSRDGANALNVMKAARRYGLEAKGYRYELEAIKKANQFPCIIHWNFNHFVVLCGFSGNKAVINDPARGNIKVSMEEFDNSFTGVCIMFRPTENFVPSGRRKTIFDFAAKRLKGAMIPILFVVLTTIITYLFGIINPGFTRFFMDYLLTGKNRELLVPFVLFMSFFAIIQIIVNWAKTIYSLKINSKLAIVGNSTYIWKILKMPLGRNKVRRREQLRREAAFIKEFATAGYVFTSDYLKVIGGFTKRKETTVVQLWHGCGAFKKFGFSTADLMFGGTREEKDKYPDYRNEDLITVSSPEVIWAYEEAMGHHGDGSVQATGISRTDVFFDEAFIRDAKERVIKAVPEAAGKKIIMYAPTFRGRVRNASPPDRLDVQEMKEALGDEYFLLIKHHPFAKARPLIPGECRDFAKDVTGSMSIDDLICSADICISDYSSLIFEYALFGRPMIFFAYDLDEYNDWRGFYYNYDELTPGPVVSTTEEIIKYIENIGSEFDADAVTDFRNKYMSACDGHATERILERIGLS